MIYLRGTTDFNIEESTVITFGKFDGIHRGHRLLLDTVLEKKADDLKAVVFTFDIPPRKKVEDDRGDVLTTNEEKMHIFENIGIDYVVECPFTEEIRNMDAVDFIRMMVEKLHVKYMVVGTDFHFGHNRKGNPELLRQAGTQYGFEVEILSKETREERPISSTWIREVLQEGNIEKVNELLGYRYFVLGEVVHGRQLGRTWGLPTINQVPEDGKLLPPFGVYASKTFIKGKTFYGISNVGVKPTVEVPFAGVETYLFDCDEDLYGEEARVEFYHFVRPECKFDSVEELKAQIQRDAGSGKRYFEKRGLHY